MESFQGGTNFGDSDVMEGGTDMEQRPSSRSADTSPQAEMHGIDNGVRQKAGEMLHGVKDRADRVGESIKSRVSSATTYVKTAQAADMWGDVKELARRNPGASMLAVAAVGFVLGRSTTRRDSR
jgi:ElaB/YqjD/DUF883 family membrane-anchored ribosome-binding protein